LLSTSRLSRDVEEIAAGLIAAPAIVRPPPPDPVDWAQRVSGLKLDDWQAEVMRWTGSDLLLNCTRQGGKTEVVSLRSAFRARFFGRRVGCLGPTLRQTGRMFRRAKNWLARDGASFAVERGWELELAEGGAIEAYPGDRPGVSIRGETLDDVIVDEASQIKDDLIAAATPTTATREDRSVIYLSTPFGAVGTFYRAWAGKDGLPWERMKATADDCPRISRRFLENEAKRLGPLFRQEYYCEFLAAPGSLFSAEEIAGLRLEPADEDERAIVGGVKPEVEQAWDGV
jgi:hypothetical protein